VKFRLALLIQHHELAIDDAITKLQHVGGDFGKELDELVSLAGEQARSCSILDEQGSITIMLELPDPVGMIERLCLRGGRGELSMSDEHSFRGDRHVAIVLLHGSETI
jgi:hypothetical protein